jgi:nitronate monooxygenase
MFLVSGVELVVAACASGILGSFPTLNCRTVEDLARWLAEIRARVGAAPWAANLVVHSSNRRLAQDLELVAEHRAPVVITALGSPRAVVDAVHAYGGVVYADVISTAFARKALDAGADGLVLVSAGAGGHFGPLAAPAFIAEVRQFFDGPVVLAGAVANARAVRACQALGADLVYMGTPFIAAAESLAAPAHKQMLVNARAEDIVATNAVTGAWANFLKPSLVAAGFDPAQPGERPKIDASDPQGEAKAWKTIWSAGQSAGQVRAVEPAAAIVARLKREYAEAVRREQADAWTRRFLAEAS